MIDTNKQELISEKRFDINLSEIFKESTTLDELVETLKFHCTTFTNIVNLHHSQCYEWKLKTILCCTNDRMKLMVTPVRLETDEEYEIRRSLEEKDQKRILESVRKRELAEYERIKEKYNLL